jgi:hypothetical protein
LNSHRNLKLQLATSAPSEIKVQCAKSVQTFPGET